MNLNFHSKCQSPFLKWISSNHVRYHYYSAHGGWKQAGLNPWEVKEESCSIWWENSGHFPQKAAMEWGVSWNPEEKQSPTCKWDLIFLSLLISSIYKFKCSSCIFLPELQGSFVVVLWTFSGSVSPKVTQLRLQRTSQITEWHHLLHLRPQLRQARMFPWSSTRGEDHFFMILQDFWVKFSTVLENRRERLLKFSPGQKCSEISCLPLHCDCQTLLTDTITLAKTSGVLDSSMKFLKSDLINGKVSCSSLFKNFQW